MSKRLLKGLLITLLTILIILLLIPFFIGINAKRNYFHLISVLNKEHPGQFQILDYQLGWFHSKAVININIPINLFDNQIKLPFLNLENTFIQHITHGPFVYNDSKRRFSFAIAKIKSYFPSQNISSASDNHIANLMKITTLIYPNGNWINYIMIPANEYQVKSDQSIKWQGLNGYIQLNTDYHSIKKIKTDFEVGKFTLFNNHLNLLAYTLSFNHAHYQNSISQKQLHTWEGNGQLDLSMNDLKLFLMMKLSFNMQLDKLKINSTFKSDRQYLHYFNTTLEFDNAKFNNKDIPNITSGKISTTLTDLNTSKIMNPSSKNTNMSLLALNDLYTQKILTTITAKTQLKYQLNFQTIYGPLLIDGVFFLGKQSLPKTIEELQNKMDYQINVKAPTNLVNRIISIVEKEKTTQLNTNLSTTSSPFKLWLDNAIKAGYILLNNNEYIINLKKDNDTVSINGKKINPSNTQPISNLPPQTVPQPGKMNQPLSSPH